MKILIILISALAVASGYAEPSAPSAEQVTEWAAFSEPIHLKAERVTRGYYLKLGDPAWIYSYSAEKQTFFSYLIGLYKAGTLYGKNRAKLEKLIGDQSETFKRLAQKNPGNDINEVANVIRIETRPDGRKAFFTVIGGAPGTNAYCGFTTIGEYDLLLVQYEDSPEDSSPVQNLAKPAKALSEIFGMLEKHIVDGM